MICPVELAHEMSAWRAVRVGDHAKHGILLEGRDGAGMQVQEAMAKEDHMVAGAVGTSLEPGGRGVQMVEFFVETEVAQVVEQSLFRKKQANCSTG
jgi:hypothetical protein